MVHKVALEIIDNEDSAYAAAVAAIKAMREPTPDMIEAGEEADQGFNLAAWHAMIDAALKDEP